MPSINQKPTLTIPVKTTLLEHAKKLMCKSLQLVKRIIGISNSTTKPSRKTRSQLIENIADYEDLIDVHNEKKVTKINAPCKIVNDATNNKVIRDFLLVRKNQYNMKNTSSYLNDKAAVTLTKFTQLENTDELVIKNQCDIKNTSSHLNDKATVTLTKFTQLENTDDAGLSQEAFINKAVKDIVQELQKSVMSNDNEEKTWRVQEFETYIPAQINRAIDSAAAAAAKSLNDPATIIKATNTLKFLNVRDNKEKIIKDTLADLKLAALLKVKNLADKAQPSIGHTTITYITLNKIVNLELTASISHRVYEIIFDCAGQIEQVIHSAEKIIKQTIAAN